MKTFKDVKVGDVIYYWDHGKMHPQTVKFVENCENIHEYTDWWGKKQIHKTPYIHIKAGKSDLNIYYDCGYSHTRCYGMNRFTGIEAANEWKEQQRKHYEYKVNKLQKKVQKYTNLIEKYS